MQGGARAHARGCHGAMLVLYSGCLGTTGDRRGTGWRARQQAKMLWAQTLKERAVGIGGVTRLVARLKLFGLVVAEAGPTELALGE